MNTYYPTNYQPYYQAPVQQSGMIWVQGESAAKSYPIAPNTSVALWDSEANTVYIKSADTSGLPSMKIIDYTVRENNMRRSETAPQNEFVTKDELSSIRRDIDALKAKIEVNTNAE